MAAIGVLPTKTSVELREPDGDKGIIPAASPSSAGVMTADQVKRLDEVYRWHQAAQAGGGIVEIIRPSESVDPALRAAVTNMSARVAQLEASLSAVRMPAQSLDVDAITERLALAERSISGLAALPVQSNPQPVQSAPATAIEEAIAPLKLVLLAQEQRIVRLEETAKDLRQMIADAVALNGVGVAA